MNSRARVRSVRGWDVGLAAAIAAVVLLGWLTAAGSNSAARHSGHISPARPSGQARPGGGVTRNFYVTPRPRGGPGGAADPGRPARR